MKKVSAFWRTVAILAIYLCLVVSTLWIAGVSEKSISEGRASIYIDKELQRVNRILFFLCQALPAFQGRKYFSCPFFCSSF